MKNYASRIIWMFLLLSVWGMRAEVYGAVPVATTQAISGQAYLKRKAAKSSMALKIRAALYVGDTIATGPKSKVTLLFNNGAILRLNEKSAIEITAPVPVGKGKQSLFRVLGGEIWSRLRPGNAVSTKSAVLGVLGTEIHLVVGEDGTSTLTVIEGRVDFGNEYGAVIVGQSQQSTARPDSAPSAPVTVQNAGSIIEWTVDLERAIVPREKFFVSQNPAEIQAALEKRAAAAREQAQNPAAHLDYGDALFDGARFEAALDAYRSAARLAPRDSWLSRAALTRSGHALIELEQLDEAAACFHAALGETTGAAPRAVPVAFAEADSPSTSYAPALVGRAWLEIARNRPQQAQAVAQQALQAAAVKTTASDENGEATAEANIVLGVALMRQPERWDAAAQAFEAALKMPSPRYHYQARAWLALVRQAQGDGEGALREALQAVELAPHSGLAQGNLSLVYFFAGQPQSARRAAEKAVSLNGKSVAARVVLGQALLAQGDVDKAETQAAYAVALDPQLPQARYLLGVAQASRRDYVHAVRELQTALRLEPGFLPAAAQLARVYNAQGRQQDAVRVLENLSGAQRKSHAAAASLAEIYYEQGNYDLSADKYREALGKKPDSALYRAELARTLLYANRLNEAINAGRQAVQLAPQVGQYHALLGLAYDFSGLKAQAERAFREALLRDPQNALALTRLADQQVGRDQRVAVGSNTQAFLYDPALSRQLLRGGVGLEVTPQTGTEQSRGVALTHRQTAQDGRLHGIGYFESSDGNGERANGAQSRFDVSQFVTYVPDGRTHILANARGVSSQGGLSGSTAAPSLDDSASLRYGQAQIAAQRRLNNGSRLWLGVFGNTSRNRVTDPGLDSFRDATTGLPVQNERFSSQALLPEVRYDLSLRRGNSRPSTLSLGLAHTSTNFDGRRALQFPLPGAALSRYEETNNATVGYAHLSHNVGSRLMLAAQVRAQSVQLRRRATVTLPGFGPTTAADAQSRTRVLPSLLASYQVNPRTALRFTTAQITTDATALTLAPTGTLLSSEGGAFPYGTPAALRLTQVQLERYFGGSDYLKLYLFEATAQNVLIGGSDVLGFGGGLPAPNAPLLQLANWKGRGAGLRYETQLGGSFFANAGLVWRSTQSGAPGALFDGATAPYEPRLLAGAELNYVSRSGVKLGTRLRHVGSFFEDAPGDAARGRFPSQFYVDLRLAKEASVRGEIFLNVTNLFNRSQIAFRDYPLGKRRLEVGVTRRF